MKPDCPLRQRYKMPVTVCFMAAGLVFLYFNLFILPWTPIWLGGDQTIWLSDGMQMLEGRVIYRDFFQFTFPGTSLVYFWLFKAFDLRTWIPNAMLILLGLALAWLGLVISKKVIKGKAAYLPSLVFLTFAYRGWLDASHHWYSVLLVMAALALVIEQRNPGRLIGAAALCGLSAFFTQSEGLVAVLALAAFLVWENRKKARAWSALMKQEVTILAVFLLTLLATNGYFVWKVGLRRFVGCTVTFVLRSYPSFTQGSTWRVYMVGLPSIHPWREVWKVGVFLFIHLLLPLVYLLFLIRYRRYARIRPEEAWDRLMIVNTVGLFQFLGVVPAPAWNRLFAVSLPAFVILIWLLQQSGRSWQAILRFLWAFTIFLMVAEPVARQLHWHAYLNLPTGRTAFIDPNMYGKYQWIFHRTRRGEFFFGGFYPDFYFLLGLRNPTDVPYITPFEYTRPDQVENVLQSLQREKVRYVLWAVELDIPDRLHPEGDHLAPLRAYIHRHYHVVKTFPNFDVWERKRVIELTTPAPPQSKHKVTPPSDRHGDGCRGGRASPGCAISSLG